MAQQPSGGPSSTAGVRATWVGHSTVLLELGGLRLLTDPLLRRRVGPLRRRRDLPVQHPVDDVDVVLLSHLHHDHADLRSLRRVGRVPVVTDPANLPWLDKHDLVPGAASYDAWLPLAPGVEVLLVRADHEARPMPHRPNGASGMLLRGGGVVVWFAGDTSLHPDMVRLPELAGAPVDLALLPVGGWGPRLSAGHMGPVQAADATARCGARHVVPIHYGTLHPTGWPTSRLEWTTDPGRQFVAVLPDWSDATAHVPPVGGAVRIPPAHALR